MNERSDWNPEPAELRDGERTDSGSHADRNLEMLRRHRDDPETEYSAEDYEEARERIIGKEEK